VTVSDPGSTCVAGGSVVPGVIVAVKTTELPAPFTEDDVTPVGEKLLTKSSDGEV
jgi:hypothetical protein